MSDVQETGLQNLECCAPPLNSDTARYIIWASWGTRATPLDYYHSPHSPLLRPCVLERLAHDPQHYLMTQRMKDLRDLGYRLDRVFFDDYYVDIMTSAHASSTACNTTTHKEVPS